LGVLLLSGLAAARGVDDSQENNQPASGELVQLNLEQLGNVEVTTVSKEPEEVWQTPAAIYVLTSEDIRRSGATTIPELLRLVPGVEVARIDSDHWAVGVRGFGSQFSRSLLVLMDGRSVYTSLFAGVYWDVQDTVIEDIDRIEVIRGPGGTIWGANAVNGVINIITKNAKETHGFLASAGGGTIDQGTSALRYGGGIGKTFSYRFYGKAFTRGPEFHGDGKRYDDWRMQRGGFRMDWDVKSHNTLTLQGDMYSGDDGDRISIGSFSPPSQMDLTGNDEVSGGNILGRWRYAFAGGSDIQVQAYYDRTVRYAPHYGETRNTFDVDFLNHIELGHRQDLLWGLGTRVSPSDFIETVPTLDFEPHHQTDSIYSGFVQDQVQIIQRKLSLTVGTKIEHNDYTGFEVLPSARLLWNPRPRQTFWASFTRAVRTPSRLDAALDVQEFLGHLAPPAPQFPVYLQVAGNPGFMVERLQGYELGYRSLITSRFYVDLSLFYNDYTNLASFGTPSIALKTSPITYLLFTAPYGNGIKGTTDGFEVAPDWKPTRWLQWKGSYSYWQPHLKNQPGNTDASTLSQDQGSSPRHLVSVQPQFNLPKKTEFDLTYRYVSALPAQKVAGYSTADVRFGWHIRGDFELSLVGQNLLQPRHAEFGSSPEPMVMIERSAFAKITWTREHN
jgi:iron complex outermembrane receptor protein